MADVSHDQAIPARPDFARVLIVDRGDVKAALLESLILHQRAAHAARADQDDAIAALEPEDVTDAARELGDGVAQAAFAERAEEGKVLTNLGRSRTGQPRQLS